MKVLQWVLALLMTVPVVSIRLANRLNLLISLRRQLVGLLVISRTPEQPMVQQVPELRRTLRFIKPMGLLKLVF